MSEVTEITSKFLSIQWRDVVKGLLIAVLTPVVLSLWDVVQHWLNTDEQLIIHWKGLIKSGIGAGVAYLAKNYFEATKTVKIIKPALSDKSGEKTTIINDGKEPTN